MKPKIGDRIQLVRMPHDPAPIEPGTRGTVKGVFRWGTQLQQVEVEWDNGRNLMLVEVDDFIILPLSPSEDPSQDSTPDGT